jgi:hypothetical protein
MLLARAAPADQMAFRLYHLFLQSSTRYTLKNGEQKPTKPPTPRRSAMFAFEANLERLKKEGELCLRMDCRRAIKMLQWAIKRLQTRVDSLFPFGFPGGEGEAKGKKGEWACSVWPARAASVDFDA